MKPRLGPLGTPLAIVFGWIAVRIVMLTPVPDARRPTSVRLASQNGSGDSAPARSQIYGSSTRLAAGPSPSLHDKADRFNYASMVRSTSRSTPVRTKLTRDKVIAANAADMSTLEPAFHGRSGRVLGFAAARRTPQRGLSGSAWELVNGVGGAVGASSLGGSQLGVRLFLQGARAPVGLTGRISRALGTHDMEVSAGYALRSHGLGLLVERRQRLDVRNGAFVVTGYGGVYDVKLPAGLRFDGFAQAGVAGIHSRRWFSDAQARVTKRGEIYPGISVGAGGGAWASAQSNARRVEVGPLVEMRVRGASTGLRVAWEYRLRVTGDARPRSGPALTVGLDF